MLYSFSIVPLSENSFDVVCKDVREQYEKNISYMPLFKMTLVPEGNPVWDKAQKFCELYARYRNELQKYGVKTGVLVQASLGHGYPIVDAPFQKYVNLTDGQTSDNYCPEDKNFVEHFRGVMKLIASQHPGAIMLDDDVRLLTRPGRGCACPLHMAKLKERTGLEMTPQKLWEHVKSHADNDPVTLAFIELQRESLVNFVKEMRDAIDEINPTIQGISCTSGDECESVIFTNPVFAGKGNPTMVRVPNGTYAPESVKGFSDVMRRAAVCKTKLKKHGIDVVLAETDTIPFNRYGKNARYLHSHYTASILEGLKGAKHWITRFCDGEEKSGRAFRDILEKHYPFYERLSSLASEIKWVGAGSVFIEQEHHMYSKDVIWHYHPGDWTRYVFERMGIPFYYCEKNEGVVFVDGDITADMTDAQLDSMFEGSVFADSVAASHIIKRGRGDLLGVSIEDADGISVKSETFDGTATCTCTKQKDLKILKPLTSRTEGLSKNYTVDGDKLKIVSPAVTALERDNGRLSVVYCGVPKASFNYIEGFAFLNETRKKQFVSLLSRVGALPIYYDGDVEICLRAGYLSDGTLLASVYNLSYDPLDTLELYLEKEPKNIYIINPDGSDVPLEFERLENRIYSVKTRVEPLYPVVLLIK